jgi:hypothetical protein
MPPLSLIFADDYDADAIIFAIIFARRFRCHADFRHAFDTPRILIDFRRQHYDFAAMMPGYFASRFRCCRHDAR